MGASVESRSELNFKSVAWILQPLQPYGLPVKWPWTKLIDAYEVEFENKSLTFKKKKKKQRRGTWVRFMWFDCIWEKQTSSEPYKTMKSMGCSWVWGTKPSQSWSSHSMVAICKNNVAIDDLFVLCPAWQVQALNVRISSPLFWQTNQVKYHLSWDRAFLLNRS